MPPPTGGDAWLASRRFGIVIDAGSSGSRLQIYSWKDARTARLEGTRLDVLPKVEKGAKDGEKWMTKVEPGLSTFAGNIEGVGPYLAPLLLHARDHVPPSLQPHTPIFLLATAGMRLLPKEHQTTILTAVCDFFRFHSDFRVGEPDDYGPCGSHIRVISGEEEGLFGWIAVNYLMDQFQGGADVDRTTYGFLDMGGASTQIAFEPQKYIREAPDENLHEVRLRLLGGEEITHDVFVTTWLGYGTNQARERYVGEVIKHYESTREDLTADVDEERVPDPCLPKDLKRVETPVHMGESTSHSRKAHTLVGTGSFEECLLQTSPLLNKTVTCAEPPCLFNGVHVPPIDFSTSKFIGVSEYWYSSEHIFGLGGPYDFVQYERAASDYCGLDWAEISQRHDESRHEGHLGGDGEVEEDGKVVAVGKWGSNVELSRLEMQCFKAAWIVNVLHEGIGLPRTIDPGGNGAPVGDEVKSKAGQKGLGAPAFQSLDSVGNTAISWALGRMVLEASKEVPPRSSYDPPLPEPMDTVDMKPVPSQSDQSDLEREQETLPSYQQSLESSPVSFFLYCLVLIGLLIITYHLRSHIRTRVWRIFRRQSQRYDRLEEGKFPVGGSSLSFGSPGTSRSTSPEPILSRTSSSTTLQKIRRFMTPRLQHSPLHSDVSLKPVLNRSQTAPRLNGVDILHLHPNGAAANPPSPRGAHFSSSPSSDTLQSVPSSHPLYVFSQSRNSSQTNLVPRQAISRNGSGYQTPSRGHYDDG